MRYTETDHSDSTTLARALQIAESALGHVNESVRARDNEEKLAWLSDNLEFSGVQAVSQKKKSLMTFEEDQMFSR